jgi:cytochrome c oxidase subunit 4
MSDKHNIVGPKTYFQVFIGLCILMFLTVGIAYFNSNLWIALAIAITKATLIILFFMQVYWSSKLTKLFVTGAFLWLGILLSMTMMDMLARRDLAGRNPSMVYGESQTLVEDSRMVPVGGEAPGAKADHSNSEEPAAH